MKILVFIVLLVAGWYFLTWIQQLGSAARRAERRTTDRRTARPAQRTMRATDTMICKRCGTYVPSEFPTACDRNDCPFPGVG
jgi:hypothetical protein